MFVVEVIYDRFDKFTFVLLCKREDTETFICIASRNPNTALYVWVRDFTQRIADIWGLHSHGCTSSVKIDYLGYSLGFLIPHLQPLGCLHEPIHGL